MHPMILNHLLRDLEQTVWPLWACRYGDLWFGNFRCEMSSLLWPHRSVCRLPASHVHLWSLWGPVLLILEESVRHMLPGSLVFRGPPFAGNH